MSILNKEKTVYAIQTFSMFLTIAKETHKQHAQEFEECRKKSLDLLEQISTNQQDLLSVAYELNRLIEYTNTLLKAPYPALMGDTSENLIKVEIVAFEHYLNQELKANYLTVQEEAPLFNDCLTLWEKVGVSLTAQEGACEFAAIIEKLNSLLPKDQHYPPFDKEQFDP